MPTTKKTPAKASTKKPAKTAQSKAKKPTTKAPAKKRSSKPSAKVAVITRTKERLILLKRAIESVLNQHFDDWLHVIVNDGGDARPVDELVAKYQKRYGDRVLVIHNKTSKGMEAASNVGVKACTSEFIVIHDDDDAWHEEFLKETVTAFEELNLPNVGAVVTHSLSVNETIEGDSITEHSREPFNDWVEHVTLWRMAAGNFFPPISLLIHRKAFDEVGGSFREDLPVQGDWEFNLRLLESYDIAVIPKLLAYYHHRIHDKTGNDVYANTINCKWHQHRFYNAMIKNELLRKDIARGTTGIGFLINMAPSMETIHWRAEQAANFLKKARSPFKPLIRLKNWLAGKP